MGLLLIVLLTGFVSGSFAQPERVIGNFSGVGVRAMGMGGAYIAVADELFVEIQFFEHYIKGVAGPYIKYEIHVPLKNLRQAHGERIGQASPLAGHKQTVINGAVFVGQYAFRLGGDLLCGKAVAAAFECQGVQWPWGISQTHEPLVLVYLALPAVRQRAVPVIGLAAAVVSRV